PHRFNEEETAQDRVNLRRLKRVPTIPAAAHGNAFECITHGSRFLCVLATVIGTISTYLVPKVPAPRGFAILRSVNRTPVLIQNVILRLNPNDKYNKKKISL
ncbi:hypothetical protein V1477_016182, partial [Vespula maculifrons]